MKKKKNNGWIIWSTVLFVVIASVLVISPMFAMDRTKTAVIEKLNDKYDDEFLITYSNLSKTPYKDSFVGIVQSQVSGASYNVTFTDGIGEIPDYAEESYLMTFNKMVEETINDSIAISYGDEKEVTVRVLTKTEVAQADFEAIEQKVKEQYEDVAVNIETMQVSKEIFEQMATEIPHNYQRSVIAQEANFDNFEPVVNEYKF